MALLRQRFNGPSRERGQGLLEFALIFPLLILLIMAILEFGIYFMTYFTVQNAAREGAREASITPELQDDDERIIEFVEGLIPLAGPFVGFEDGITLNGIDDCQINNLVTVTVSGQYNFVALNVLGLNGINLNLPSTTHYELCDQYTGISATSTPGPSPTSAPSSTNTLAATLTPTRTPTPTITPTPSRTPTPTRTNTPQACAVVGFGLSYGNDDDVYWWLYNGGSQTERISRVTFDWVDHPPSNYYDFMELDGDLIHEGNDNDPPTSITGGWNGASWRREISPGSWKQLNIDFRHNHPSNGFSVEVEFESGCVVSSGG